MISWGRSRCGRTWSPALCRAELRGGQVDLDEAWQTEDLDQTVLQTVLARAHRGRPAGL